MKRSSRRVRRCGEVYFNGRLGILLWAWLFFFCLGAQCVFTDDDCESPPSECPKAEPGDVEVRFEFTIAERFGSPILMTYSGENFEESHLVRVDTVDRESFGLLLPPGKHAFVARYIAGQDTLELLEEANSKVSSQTYCGGVTCYQAKEDRVDFRLFDVPSRTGR